MHILFPFILSCLFSFLSISFTFGAERNVVAKNESIPINLPTPSCMANYIMLSPLDYDFFAVLSDTELANESYKMALKSELVDLQRVRFGRGLKYLSYPVVGQVHVALDYLGSNGASSKDTDAIWMVNKEMCHLPTTMEKKIDIAFQDKEMVVLTEKYVEKVGIKTFDTPEHGITKKKITFPDAVTCLRFGASGNHILCSINKEFYVKSLINTDEHMKRIPLPKHPFPGQAALDAEGKIAIIGSDSDFYIINMNRESQATHIECKNIKGLSLAARGNRLAVHYEQGEKNYVAFYDTHTGRLEGKLLRPDLTAMAVSPCGRYILMGFKSGALLLYDVASRQQGLTGTLNLSVKNVTWSGNSRVIAALTEQQCYIILLDSRADALPLDAIILATKAYGFSTEKVCSHAFFRTAYEKLKIASTDQAKITILALSDLRLCNRCKNECGACKIYGCTHQFCESCFGDILNDRPRCPVCAHKIDQYIGPDGHHSIASKAIID